MITDGIALMFIGVSVVFAVLLLMIFLVNLTAYCVERFSVQETNNDHYLEIAVAIAAARHYRTRQGGNN